MRSLHQIMQSQLNERYVMTDNVAVLKGYTAEVYGEYNGMDFHLLVKPHTDLSQRFHAWDMDNRAFGYVNGWVAELNYC